MESFDDHSQNETSVKQLYDMLVRKSSLEESFDRRSYARNEQEHPTCEKKTTQRRSQSTRLHLSRKRRPNLRTSSVCREVRQGKFMSSGPSIQRNMLFNARTARIATCMAWSVTCLILCRKPESYRVRAVREHSRRGPLPQNLLGKQPSAPLSAKRYNTPGIISTRCVA